MNTQESTSLNGQNDYINARIESSKLQCAMIITMIFIAPLGLLYAFIGLLASQDFILNGLVKIILVIICLAWVGMAMVFMLLRKYWVFKISTNHTGISFIGLFRKIHAHWNEIISIEVISTGILFGGQMIEVRTRPGIFFFPLTMKEKGKEFPKLDLLGEKWVTSTGDKKPISPDNCLLYTNIQQRKT